MRILVVDDFLTMRRVVRGFLREMGFDDADVAEAAHGAAALEELRLTPADVVITDIEMPILGGFGLLSAIKKDAALRDETFDVVVTDIEMPTLGGFELLSAIRRDARWRHLPVLMVTAEATKEEIVRCTQAGATAYLVKPFTRAVLEEKLRSAIPSAFASNE